MVEIDSPRRVNRLIFSVDYPYSDDKRATHWLQHLTVEPEVRARLTQANADEPLGLR